MSGITPVTDPVPERFGRIRALDRSKGRDLIVGDIHGCFSDLDSLLSEMSLDPTRDRVICVGDLIDRGPDSEAVVDWLDEDWFYAVRGNHDQMLLDAYQQSRGVKFEVDWALNHIRNGGLWFVGRTPAEQQETVMALSNLPWAITIETASEQPICIVHAAMPGGSLRTLRESLAGPESQTMRQDLLWDREQLRQMSQSQSPPRFEGVDRVFFGHTILPEPLSIANGRWIDTGCYRSQRLTLIELTPESERVYQFSRNEGLTEIRYADSNSFFQA